MNNKKDKNDLSGFEELLEDFVSTENSKQLKREISESKNFDNFELERYLEIENERLSNLESFFTKKIPNKLNFSQSEKLSKIQTKRIEEIKEKINQKIDNFDSTLNRNLSKLFDHIF
jgi:hypothetical protein